MDDAERDRRRQEFTAEIRRRQADLGHDSPLPAFLNLMTDRVIDLELEMERTIRELHEARYHVQQLTDAMEHPLPGEHASPFIEIRKVEPSG
jgi:hypothetical protein